jgi:hypothetical protein
MRIHTMEQRTPEWDAMRAGKITGSVASKLVTPTGKPSAQAKSEIGRIIAESEGWQPPEFLKPTFWMERGVKMEIEARNWFQIETGLKVTECGFIEHDSGLAGFSPDGYIMDGDVLIPVEFKCPKPSTHVTYLLEDGIPKTHIGQCHFGLAITDAPYMYFMSYCPNAAPKLLKVERTDYTDLMKAQIESFVEDLADARELVVIKLEEAA